MNLAMVYRSITQKHFPEAIIVADRFQVIRLINHHFLACWREIDAVGSNNRGLLSRCAATATTSNPNNSPG